MNKKEILEKANYYNEYFKDYSYILEVFSFDHETVAPINSTNEANKAMSRVSNDLFKVLKSDDYINYVIEAYNHKDEFDIEYQRKFELQYREYEKSKNITPELDYEMSLTISTASSMWKKAKEKNDYSLFEPHLKKIVELKRKEISLRDKKFDTPYDSLLDDYESGNNERILDKFFEDIKNGIVPLLKRIVNSKKKIREDFLTYNVPIWKQEKLSNWILNFNDFDLNSGVISTTEHPFTCFPSEHDTRITTHYHENDYLSNIFSVAHEGGHAIFGQNEPHKFFTVGMEESMTSAMHETISRFYENIIGRNRNYLLHLYNKTNEVCGDTFKDVSFDEFYEGVNIVRPSLIRTEADELTYCLHILIRYELEKGLINGTIDTKDLNVLWNKKYKEYLGIEPKGDKDGILQDMHWGGGLFGYFPSYALGNAYGAMILNRMKKDLDFDETLKEGNLKAIKEWLKNNVFNIAGLNDPNEWIKKITGKEFSTKEYIEYLSQKYEKIYQI